MPTKRKLLINFPEVPEGDRVKHVGDLEGRLRHERRWQAAERYFKTVVKKCKLAYEPTGIYPHPKIIAFAWSEVAKQFPPLAPKKLKEIQKEGLPLKPGEISGLNRLPSDWGPLKNDATFEADVRWVHHNRLPPVVNPTENGAWRVVLSSSGYPAPSRGALSWLEFAIKNPTTFMKDTLTKALRGGGDEEEEGLRRERKSIQECNERLEEHREHAGLTSAVRGLLALVEPIRYQFTEQQKLLVAKAEELVKS